jgi:hypothetical protein
MKKPDDPFVVGFHTKIICNRIDKAFDDFRNGKSTYLIINTHHRTGKTDMISRFLGPHFIGEFPDKEVMQTAYNKKLATSFSAYGRNIFRSEKYKQIYPEVYLSRETNKKDDWIITNQYGDITGGRLYASGLRAGLTGNGFHLGIVDDWFSSRKDAESETMRNNVWEAFKDDFTTRSAPVTIMIIIGTSWHHDGLIGRVRKQQKEDRHFPKFEELVFPAKAENYRGPGEYKNKYLFMERYDEGWYQRQYATLGRYSAAALLDCDPYSRTGGILNIKNIVFHDLNDPEVPKLNQIKWAQVWDLAHTAKQRTGDDPDYTSGTLMAFNFEKGDPVPHLWIRNRIRIREHATERDKIIDFNTRKLPGFITHGIESSLDSKDAFQYIRNALPQYSWKEIKCTGDKAVRAVPLEPIFDAEGHVHVIRGDYVDDWLTEIESFTGTNKEHDDGVDNLTAGYELLVHSRQIIPDEEKKEFAKRRRAI